MLDFQWPKGEKITHIRPPHEFYKGKLGNFYNPELFPELRVLKENWKQIRDEILRYEEEHGNIKQMDSFSPAAIKGNNWSTVFLRNYMWNFYRNMRNFPVTSSIIKKIPNCTYAVISVLAPNTSINPHFGDTNGTIRVHLGLVIPGTYPDLGIRVDGEDNSWKEGELVCYPDIKQHEAWNKTPFLRYLLIIDIVPNVLKDKKKYICKKALGNQSYIFFYRRFKLARILPIGLQSLIASIFSEIWGVYLFFQEKLDKCFS